MPFIKDSVSPVLIANIDDSQEPTMQSLYKKHLILERSGIKVGIIGYTLHDLDVSESIYADQILFITNKT